MHAAGTQQARSQRGRSFGVRLGEPCTHSGFFWSEWKQTRPRYPLESSARSASRSVIKNSEAIARYEALPSALSAGWTLYERSTRAAAAGAAVTAVDAAAAAAAAADADADPDADADADPDPDAEAEVEVEAERPTACTGCCRIVR